MTVIGIKGMRGVLPRYSARLLQDNQAHRAWNARITAGRLDPIKGPGLVSTLGMAQAIRTMYRYRHFVGLTPLDNWLAWGHDVDVELSPLANDERGVFYFTSADFEPRISSYALAINGTAYPDAWYALGVPNPTVAPTVVPSGGSASDEERSYAYTFVTQWGEESGPSPASALATGKEDGTWTISDIQTAPPNSGTVTAAVADTPTDKRVTVTLNTVFGLAARESVTFASVLGMTDLNGTFRLVSVDPATNKVVIDLDTSQTYTSGGTWARDSALNTTGMVKRIYRSAGTNPAFLFVAEIPAATTSYADTIPGTQLNETIETLATLPPPKDLTCFRVLPNGCGIGLSGNSLCLSDPYKLYSWPMSNRYSFSGRGVDLVVAGTSVIVLTDSFPILFTGSDPEVMSPSTIESYAPCVSKRGVVNVGGGAVYPSFDGLWLVTPGGAKKLTQNLYRDKEWAELNPASFMAAFHDGQYYAQYEKGGAAARIWVLDISEPDSATEVDEQVGAMHSNVYDGKLYLSKGNRIFLWDSDEGRRYEMDWMSKLYQLPAPATFAFAQVFADFGEIVPIDTSQQAENAEIMALPQMASGQVAAMEFLGTEVNASLITPVVSQTARRVQFTIYVDNVPKYSKAVTSQRPFRLPTGYRSELVSVQISASVPVYSVAIASSIDELKQVAP